MRIIGEQGLREGTEGPGEKAQRQLQVFVISVPDRGGGDTQQLQLIPVPCRAPAGSPNVEQMDLCRWSVQNP